jgi:hypothetical protein
MKYQESPPALTIAPPVDFASMYVSNAQCMEFGVHALPVTSDDAVLVAIMILFFSLTIDASASAHDVAAISMMMSTPRWSNHSRASDTATSGLF